MSWFTRAVFDHSPSRTTIYSIPRDRSQKLGKWMFNIFSSTIFVICYLSKAKMKDSQSQVWPFLKHPSNMHHRAQPFWSSTKWQASIEWVGLPTLRTIYYVLCAKLVPTCHETIFFRPPSKPYVQKKTQLPTWYLLRNESTYPTAGRQRPRSQELMAEL